LEPEKIPKKKYRN